MQRLQTSVALLLFFATSIPVCLFAQGSSDSQSAKSQAVAASAGATRDDLDELRGQVAAQQQTIEELRGMVERLMHQQQSGSPQLVNAAVIQSQPASADDTLEISQKSAQGKSGDGAPVTAGWNGEHFYIKSADGTFQIQPYGYVNGDYRAYRGDGAPPNTFLVRRARFGFQGNYGSHFQFALLTDAGSTSGSIVRDVYINVKVIPEFQIQAGQFKEPFAQEEVVGITNIDFVERGLQSLLYPGASSAYRSPGVTVHGDIYGGKVQYWVGAFNGHGYVVPATTSEPEVIGRLRFYPWRSNKDSVLQGLAFGGAIAHGRSRGLSGDSTFNATMPDNSYVFFPTTSAASPSYPSFVVNGPTERYNGEFTYLRGPMGIRGEYNTLSYARNGIGSLEFGGLAFLSAPEIRARGWNIAATYLLTGEKRPENGIPRVKHPWLGPETPGGGPHGWGAWEVGVRYSGVQVKEPGFACNSCFTPGSIPPFDDHTDQFTFGLNWYPNYWVRYSTEFNIDRLKQPSMIGALPQNYFVVLQRFQFRF